VNGVVALPLRLQDAPALTVTSASYSSARIVCVVSPGVGAGFQLLVREVWTDLLPNGVRVGYQPPVVTSVSPEHLPVTGGDIVVVGTGFGSGPCADTTRLSAVQLQLTAPPGGDRPAVAFNASSGAWGPSLVRTLVACAVRAWTPTAVTCTAPPGLDALVDVRMDVGGQAVVATAGTGYSPPAVTGVIRLEPLGTRGGGRVLVTGSEFPPEPWPMVVLVGGAECVVDAAPGSRNSSALRCRVPRGAGKAPVVVSTPLQASALSADKFVVYDPPQVAEVITPQGRSIEGGFTVVIRGIVRQDAGVG
jgi:hypothetical protein